MLVSAASTCYIATLTYILGNRKLPVVENAIESEVIMSDNELKIMHYPHIVLAADATEAQIQSAERAFEGADRGC